MSTEPTEPTTEPMPEPEAQGTEPTPERKGRGGRRPGAGRKPASDRASLSAKPKRAPGRPSNHAQRASRVAALYDQLGSLMFLGAPFDPRLLGVGVAMTENATALGEAWATWADTSPRVAELLDRTSFGGAGVGVLIAHVPIVKAAMFPPALGADGEAPAGAGGLLDIFARLAGGDVAGLVDMSTPEG